MRHAIRIVTCLWLATTVGCSEPTSSQPGEASRPLETARPAGMAGHWRFTDVMSSGDFSLVTDINLVLEADGGCRTWTKHGDGSGDPESTGVWKTEGDRLLLGPAGGATMQDAGRFTMDGDRMRLVLPNGTIQVFQRQ